MYERLDKCPICTNQNFKNELICKDHLVSGESFAISSCLRCGLKLTNPRPNQESIAKYYDSHQYLSHNNDNTVTAKLYSLAQTYTLWYKARLIAKLNPPHKTLLDYGCGTGQFLHYMQRKSWAVTGFETSDVALQKAASRGVEVLSSLDTIKETDRKFDVITLWHVLEHIHDLNPTIKKLRKLLKKGGRLVIAVPNAESWDAAHYKENWAAYDVPRHLYHFSENNIKTLFKSHKFSFHSKRPLYLDSFYISLLSEQHSGKGYVFAKAILNGCRSNIYGLKTGQFSSMVYTFNKK